MLNKIITNRKIIISGNLVEFFTYEHPIIYNRKSVGGRKSCLQPPSEHQADYLP
jgi:hypothetical protein